MRVSIFSYNKQEGKSVSFLKCQTGPLILRPFPVCVSGRSVLYLILVDVRFGSYDDSLLHAGLRGSALHYLVVERNDIIEGGKIKYNKMTTKQD